MGLNAFFHKVTNAAIRLKKVFAGDQEISSIMVATEANKQHDLRQEQILQDFLRGLE